MLFELIRKLFLKSPTKAEQRVEESREESEALLREFKTQTGIKIPKA